MNFGDSYNTKRRSQVDDDDIDEEQISFKKDVPTQQSDSNHPTITTHQINSYLARESQMHMENYNEQITSIQKAIIQEENCPEILAFERNLYDNLCEIVENQDQALQEVEKTIDKKTYFNIYSLELERIKYLLKSYLRTRLFKV